MDRHTSHLSYNNIDTRIDTWCEVFTCVCDVITCVLLRLTSSPFFLPPTPAPSFLGGALFFFFSVAYQDNKLVFTGLDEQESNESSFVRKCHCVVPPDNVGGSGEGEGEGTDDGGRGFGSAASADGAVSATQDWAVLEIGAGTVVPSIRMMAQVSIIRFLCLARSLFPPTPQPPPFPPCPF